MKVNNEQSYAYTTTTLEEQSYITLEAILMKCK